MSNLDKILLSVLTLVVCGALVLGSTLKKPSVLVLSTDTGEQALGYVDGTHLETFTASYLEATSELKSVTLALTGAFTGTSAALSGELNALEGYTESTATTNTLTAAMSGETFYLSGAASTYILPATSSASGVVYKFVVDGAITANQTIVTTGGSNIIEGALIVAGAVVDCDAEDTITIVADGENIGDFVEVRSDGDYWFIGASGALTTSKMTCTTST